VAGKLVKSILGHIFLIPKRLNSPKRHFLWY